MFFLVSAFCLVFMAYLVLVPIFILVLSFMAVLVVAFMVFLGLTFHSLVALDTHWGTSRSWTAGCLVTLHIHGVEHMEHLALW